MPVQSLNIHLSNAAICSLSCSSEKGRGGGGGGGGGGGEEGARHNQLGTLMTIAYKPTFTITKKYHGISRVSYLT